MTDESLIARCEQLLMLAGREPCTWPVPIKREDLEALLAVYVEAAKMERAY
jgi:hypothetical protein